MLLNYLVTYKYTIFWLSLLCLSLESSLRVRWYKIYITSCIFILWKFIDCVYKYPNCNCIVTLKTLFRNIFFIKKENEKSMHEILFVLLQDIGTMCSLTNKGVSYSIVFVYSWKIVLNISFISNQPNINTSLTKFAKVRYSNYFCSVNSILVQY